MTSERRTGDNISGSWLELNLEYLNHRLNILRLLINRRILWLRSLWRQDPLQSYQGTVISDIQADILLKGEDREDEARFYHENQEAAAISHSLAEQERQLEEKARKLREAGTPPAMEILARLFNLNSFEQKVLFLCLAPELDPGFEQLYAYVQDVPKRTYATWQLARLLFEKTGFEKTEFEKTEEDRTAAEYGLLPDAPLRRFLLVTLESGQYGATPQVIRPLRIDERIGDYLKGINRLDERLSGLLRPIPISLRLPGHEELAERWIALFEGFEDRPWPVLNITGPKRSGKYSLARAICDRLRVQLVSLDLRRAAAQGTEIHDLIRLLDREAILLRAVFYMDMAGYSGTDSSLPSVAGEIIERLGARLIIASEERWTTERLTIGQWTTGRLTREKAGRWTTERDLLVIPLSKPDAAEQVLLWRQALDGVKHSLDIRVPALVEQFDFGPEEIARAVASAENKARMRHPRGEAGVAVHPRGEAVLLPEVLPEVSIQTPLEKIVTGGRDNE